MKSPFWDSTIASFWRAGVHKIELVAAFHPKLTLTEVSASDPLLRL